MPPVTHVSPKAFATALVAIFAVAVSAMAQQLPPAPPGVAVPPNLTAPPTQHSGPSLTRSCPFCDLRGVDLRNLDLTDVNLQGADLTGANLSGANLSGAVLARAKLTNADLTNARLSPSAKGHADLSAASLAGAKLRGAIFDGTDLQYADLSGADRTGVDLSRALIGEVPRPRGTDPITCGAADLSKLTQRVYVSTTGTDSDTCGATPAQACRSIARGLDRCTSATCGTLVMWGTYKLTTSLHLKSSNTAKTTTLLYGGCGVSTPKPQSLIDAPDGGAPALVADASGLVQGFKLQGTAAPSTTPSEVSLTLQIIAPDVTVQDTRVHAGSGSAAAVSANGQTGTTGVAASGVNPGITPACNYAQGGPGSVLMQENTTWDNGWHTSVTCNVNCGPTQCRGGPAPFGGFGGNPGRGACTGCPYDQGQPGFPGNPGSAGQCGSGGLADANTAGTWSPQGTWAPATSQDGSIAWAGGGGGGGGAGGYKGGMCGIFTTYSADGNQGGGGGSGGCGGSGGGGGIAGGAALGVQTSVPFSLIDSVVVGGRGGDGAKGGTGGQGGQGGAGAPGLTPRGGADGGPGAPGAGGGAGGGGAGGNGGPAFGIVLLQGRSQIPVEVRGTGSAYYLGSSGVPGAGGSGGPPVVAGACTGSTGATGQPGTVADKFLYSTGQ